jgi:hypothetical protein
LAPDLPFFVFSVFSVFSVVEGALHLDLLHFDKGLVSGIIVHAHERSPSRKNRHLYAG